MTPVQVMPALYEAYLGKIGNNILEERQFSGYGQDADT
jgi:hypothetical protein